jgi:hypothetical protein
LWFNPSYRGIHFREIAREPHYRCILAFVILGAGFGRATADTFNNWDKQSHPAPFASPQTSRRQKAFRRAPQTFPLRALIFFLKHP